MDFSQDELASVLARIADRRTGIYPPGSWRQVATFISLRNPERIDVAAFRRFQAALLDATGFAPVVVGGVFGCVKLFVRLVRPDEPAAGSAPAETRSEGSDDPADDDAVRIVAAALAADPALRALGLEAGVSRVQTHDTSIDLRGGKSEAYGFGRRIGLHRFANPVVAPLFDVDEPSDVGFAFAEPEQPGPSEPPGAWEVREAFHFVLRGEAARGNAIAMGSQAQLSFDYGLPPGEALATIRSPHLDEARRAELDIMLCATVSGPLAIVGSQQALARFRNGAMVERAVFRLHAGNEPGEAVVHVDYLVRGELVHQSEIGIDVVASPARLRTTTDSTRTNGPPPADLKSLAAVSAAPEQRIFLSLGFAGGMLRIALSDFRGGQLDFQDEYQSTLFDTTRLETMLKAVHNEMARCYADRDFWEIFDGTIPAGAPGRIAVDALAETLGIVAAAGSLLNDELREDEEIGKALDYIEANAAPGTVLSVSTDKVFLPWELLFPEHRTLQMVEDGATPPDAGKFWGARFAIETDKRGIGSLTRLRDEHLKQRPKVALNLNPTITIAGVPAASQPLAVQQGWARKLEERGLLEGVKDSCKDVRPVLQYASTAATLIYVYCHGNSPEVFRGIDESLVLADDCTLRPRDLRTLPAYSGAPIIFLNSCKAGVSSPLTFSSFLAEFRTRGALGLIATSFSVPIAFAARFGQEVVESYLGRRGSLAVEMLHLRRAHLLERGDPVPLFYTLQCHLDAPALP